MIDIQSVEDWKLKEKKTTFYHSQKESILITGSIYKETTGEKLSQRKYYLFNAALWMI